MPWVAVSLQLEPAAAEALSNALLETGAHSVWLEGLDAPLATLHALFPQQTDCAQALQAAAQASGLDRLPGYAVEEIADEDWVRKTQAQFAPIEIGRLWVGPSWHEAPADRVAVRLDPGLAFGTGSHPTTRLVLRFLERTIAGGERVLDYGCGSGILAIAAAKLGAAHVDAVDVDPVAVETTAANARANGVSLHAGLTETLSATDTYDIVVSNILAQPLILLAPLLGARAAPGSRIALAGILESQADEVARAYSPGFRLRTSAVEEGWALVEGVRA